LNPTIPTPGMTSAMTPTEMKRVSTASFGRYSDWLAGAFGFALMVAYWPGISGAASTPRWDVAAILAVVLFVVPAVRMTPAHWTGLVLVAWMGASLLWNDAGQDGLMDGIDNASQLVMIAIAFAVGSTMANIVPLFIGAAIGIGINSGFAVAQWHDWHGVVETSNGSYAGLFYERDRLAAAAALVIIGVIALRRWYLLPLLLPSVMLAPSRAAWLAIGAGLIAMSREWSWRSRAASASLVLIGLVGYVVWFGPGPSGNERLMIWQDTINNLTYIGHGLGSFREDFLQFASTFNIAVQHTRPEQPHNEWLWLCFEGGVPGLAMGMVFAIAVWKSAGSRPERGILAGLFVLSLFAMPLHDPATVILGAIVAGYLAGRHAMARIVLVDCRDPLCPWLASLDGRGWNY